MERRAIRDDPGYAALPPPGYKERISAKRNADGLLVVQTALLIALMQRTRGGGRTRSSIISDDFAARYTQGCDMLHETFFDALGIWDDGVAQPDGVGSASFPLLWSPFCFLAQRYRSCHGQSCAKEAGSYGETPDAYYGFFGRHTAFPMPEWRWRYGAGERP